MERLLPAQPVPFEVGALYSRQRDIHDHYGGSRQPGISASSSHPYVFLFTGITGARHGYHDFWDDEGTFHYFGEGQSGDMQYVRGNRAIRDHLNEGKRLLVFQGLGHGLPYRFLGEFQLRTPYLQADILDTNGSLRTAIVFKLTPIESTFDPFLKVLADKLEVQSAIDLASTSREQLVAIRSKQDLFRKNLVLVERQCRLTKIADLRFLRASHIKPWAKCSTGDERVSGSNGLLLSPHADFLFDRGWISFGDSGGLLRSRHLPKEVVQRIGLDLKSHQHFTYEGGGWSVALGAKGDGA